MVLTEIVCKISPKFDQFRSQRTFLDVTLEHQDKIFSANRIVLAAQSSWFHDYFTANPGCHNIRFEENFGEHFEDLIDFFYTGSICVNPISYAEIAHLAFFFRVASLQAMLAQHLSIIVSEMNVLDVFSSLNHAGLFALSRTLLPLVAKVYSNKVNFTRADLIASLATPIVVPLLEEPQLSGLSVFERIEFINDFIENRPLTPEERDTLEPIINWDHPDALTAFSRYSCDWLPLKLQKKLIRKLYAQRASLLGEFTALCETEQESVGRWFPFSWLSHIAAGRKETAALHMISTLGDSTGPFNPIPYGLVRVRETAPVVPIYGIAGIFDANPRHYFMSQLTDDVTPSVEFFFGKQTRCAMKTLRLSSKIKNCHGKFLKAPEQLNVYGHGEDDPEHEIFSAMIEMVDGEYAGQVEGAMPFGSIGIQMTQLGQCGSTILRLSKFDFDCEFIP